MSAMPLWLESGLAYVRVWLAHQMRKTEQLGCSVAISYRGNIVLCEAWGSADLDTGETLTPEHRFRVVSPFKELHRGCSVVLASPDLTDPLLKATECQLVGPDEARIVEASAFGNYGETVRLVRGEDRSVAAVQIAQEKWVLEAHLKRELIQRYDTSPPAPLPHPVRRRVRNIAQRSRSRTRTSHRNRDEHVIFNPTSLDDFIVQRGRDVLDSRIDHPSIDLTAKMQDRFVLAFYERRSIRFKQGSTGAIFQERPSVSRSLGSPISQGIRPGQHGVAGRSFADNPHARRFVVS
jgi:hypothetical protein